MRLAVTSCEIRSLAFDRCVLRERSNHDESGTRRGSHQILDKRIVHDAEDRAFLVDQTEGDAAEWKAVHEVRGAICDARVHASG